MASYIMGAAAVTMDRRACGRPQESQRIFSVGMKLEFDWKLDWVRMSMENNMWHTVGACE